MQRRLLSTKKCGCHLAQGLTSFLPFSRLSSVSSHQCYWDLQKFLVSFSHSFTPELSLLTLPTVPTIFVQTSLTTSIEGASLEVGTLPFIRNFLWVFQRWFCCWNFLRSAHLCSCRVQTLSFSSVSSRALISTFRFNEWNSLLSFLRRTFRHLVIGLLFC